MRTLPSRAMIRIRLSRRGWRCECTQNTPDRPPRRSCRERRDWA
jgi:hypothetical protein